MTEGPGAAGSGRRLEPRWSDRRDRSVGSPKQLDIIAPAIALAAALPWVLGWSLPPVERAFCRSLANRFDDAWTNCRPSCASSWLGHARRRGISTVPYARLFGRRWPDIRRRSTVCVVIVGRGRFPVILWGSSRRRSLRRRNRKGCSVGKAGAPWRTLRHQPRVSARSEM